MTFERDAGSWSVDGSWYRLSGTTDGPTAILADRAGKTWAELRLLASVDTVAGVDETFAVEGPDSRPGADGAHTQLVWTLASSIWTEKRLVLDLASDTIAIRVEVGRAARSSPTGLTDVTLLGGRVVEPRATGFVMSGAWFASLVPAAPADPRRIVQPASESAAIGVVSGSEPGRGRWFFTPAPFVFAASQKAAANPATIPAGPWIGFSIDTTPGHAGFTEVAYRAIDRGFAFSLDYDGHTSVAERWTSPPLVIATAADPFAAIAAQRRRLAERERPSGSPNPPRRLDAGRRAVSPAWWREPMFCGWGAQCAIVAADGRPMSAAPSVATQAHYDRFLEHLAVNGVIPGTIVIDDKWQAQYGTNEVDVVKWPDLRGWIQDRRRGGQRVLLWYKAWDPEGLPANWCVRSAAGTPLALDPEHPDGEAALRHSIRAMLGSAGLGADGLKIDFTARTPSGRATVHHGSAWGVDLLRRLLDVVADEARRTNPEALLVGHTPNVLVASAVDMIRLNDALRLDDPDPATDIVPQMRFRTAVVRAACPDHLVDTDDWSAPDLAAWRAYTEIKAELGVPVLYYATHIDRTGEALQERDYALLRRVWSDYRRATGLAQRPTRA